MARAAPTQDIETFPEADRLEGFPHPRETAQLFGHEAAQGELLRAFARGHMHHAWLISGGIGIGKATLAYRLASFVLASAAEREEGRLAVAPASSAARQVRALSHPGLLVLRRPYDPRSKKLMSVITVDEVRRLKSFLGLTAGDEAWRVVIVDSADELNPNAANAILKSLEEPPLRTLFVLLSSEPGALLPTVRSRCRRVHLSPLGSAELRGAAQAALDGAGIDAPDAAQWSRVEPLAEGSVRRALQLLTAGGLESYEGISRILTVLPRVDWPAAHALTDALAASGSEQRFDAFIDLLLDTLGRLGRSRTYPRPGPADATLADRLIAPDRLSDWAGMWAAILRERSETDLLNLDRKAFLLRILNRLQQSTAK
jgi:DNA polymerase III subunit delta'